MPKNTNNETYQPITFDSIKIGLASPEKFWSGLTERLLSRKQSTTEH